MSNVEVEKTVTHWPDGEADVPVGPVVRVIYASRSLVHASVLDEMRRIRNHAVVNNGPADIRVVLFHTNGWFVQWMEGMADGVEQLLARVSKDMRHRDLMVIHRSEGQPRLFRPWIGSIVQAVESERQFEARVLAQYRRHNQGEQAEPASVWTRLCSPYARDMPRPWGRNPKVMLLSVQGTLAFNLLEWLTLHEQRTLVRRRFAGSVDDAPDVESDYIDLPEHGPRGLRLIANARQGLAMGMAHALLPDHAAVVVLLGSSPERNQRLIERVLVACRQVHHNALIVGVGSREQVSEALGEAVMRQGMPWAGVVAQGASPDAAAIWAALAPLLVRLQ